MPDVIIPPSELIADDFSVHLGNTFETWRSDHIAVSFDGVESFKEVFIDKSTLENLMLERDGVACEGVLFYRALIEIDDPDNQGQKIKVTTLAAVGVNGQGNLLNGQDGPFYISRPCPPYCASWD